MSDFALRHGRDRVIAQHWANMAWVAAFVAVFAVAIPHNDGFGWLNADTTWLLSVALRMLEGERLYVDVWDTNPPFSVLLYLPAAWMEQLTGVRGEIWITGGLLALTAISLVLCGEILRRVQFATRNSRRALLLVFAIICLYVMPGEFAQREHFGAIAALPLVLLYAVRPQWRDTTRMPLPLSLAVGAMGALIILVKPQYALGYLLPALWVLLRDRDWALIHSPAHLAGAVIVSVYAGSVLVLFPAFLSDVMPVVVSLYIPERIPLLGLLWQTALVFTPALALGIAIWRFGGADSALTVPFGLAAFGFWLACLAAGKGWAYHYLPAAIMLFASVASLIVSSAGKGDPVKRAVSPCLAALAFALTVFAVEAHHRRELPAPAGFEPGGAEVGLALIGTDHAVGTLLARRLGANWSERENSDTLAALAWRRLQLGQTDHAEKLTSTVESALARKARYIVEAEVDYVFVDMTSPGWVEFVLSDRRIARALAPFAAAECHEQVAYLVRTNPAPAEAQTANWPATLAAFCPARPWR